MVFSVLNYNSKESNKAPILKPDWFWIKLSLKLITLFSVVWWRSLTWSSSVGCWRHSQSWYEAKSLAATNKIASADRKLFIARNWIKIFWNLKIFWFLKIFHKIELFSRRRKKFSWYLPLEETRPRPLSWVQRKERRFSGDLVLNVTP